MKTLPSMGENAIRQTSSHLSRALAALRIQTHQAEEAGGAREHVAH